MPEMSADIEGWLELTHLAEYYLKKSRLEIFTMKRWEIEASLAFYIERKKEENKKG